jgi:hypothetical protein
MLRDLERLAINFASQLRSAAWHTEALGSDKLSELRAILEDTMTRIRDEVFTGPDQGHDPGAAAKPGETEPSARNDPPTG